MVRPRRAREPRLQQLGRAPDVHGPAHDRAGRSLGRLRRLLARLLADEGEHHREGARRSPGPFCLNGRPMGPVHWDEVEGSLRDKGPMAATWQHLGDAAGAKGIGLNRVRVEPGRLSTPPHSHGLSEEIYFVLEGSGLLWQDEAVCEVRAGDTVVAARGPLRAHLQGRPRRARVPRLRDASSGRVRLAAALAGAAARLPVGRGTRRQPMGDRGRGRRARVRRAGRAAAECGRARGRPGRRRRRPGARRGGGLGAVRV